MFRYLTIFALVLSFGVARAEDKKADPKAAKKGEVEVASYYRDVRPILQKHCMGCHQPAKAGGKLILLDYASLLRGGRSQEDDPIVVAGKPQESLLFTEVVPEDGKASMPKKAAPLSKIEIEKIHRWIAQGAKDDTPANAKGVQASMEKPPVYESAPVISSVDYSPDGKLLAVSGYHEVIVHRADGSGMVARLVGLSERIEKATFSHDGKRIAVTGGSPGRFGEVQIWDLEKRKLLVSTQVTYDTIYGGDWSHDDKLFAFGCSDNTLRAIETKGGKQVLFQGAHSDWVLDAAFSKDSSHLCSVSRDRTLKLVVVKTEQFVDNITSITPGALKGGLLAVDRHPKEDQLLVGGADGSPKIYRMFREKARKIGDDYNLIRRFDALPGRVFDTEFDREAKRVVACSSADRKGEIRVYNAADGKQTWKVQLDEPIYTVAFSPDGKWVAAGGFKGVVRIYDASSGKQVKQFVPVPLSF